MLSPVFGVIAGRIKYADFLIQWAVDALTEVVQWSCFMSALTRTVSLMFKFAALC